MGLVANAAEILRNDIRRRVRGAQGRLFFGTIFYWDYFLLDYWILD